MRWHGRRVNGTCGGRGAAGPADSQPRARAARSPGRGTATVHYERQVGRFTVQGHAGWCCMAGEVNGVRTTRGKTCGILFLYILYKGFP